MPSDWYHANAQISDLTGNTGTVNTVFFEVRVARIIRDDATGGDCASFGTWDDATKTCSLNSDLFIDLANGDNGIVIADSNITLDGNGHVLSVQEGRWGYIAVTLDGPDGVAVRNLSIRGFSLGVQIQRGDNISLMNNTIEGGSEGIHVNSCENCAFENNAVITASDSLGVFINANNSRIAGNSSSQAGTGLIIYGNGNEITGNSVSGCWYNTLIIIGDGNTITRNNVGRTDLGGVDLT